MPWEVEMLQYSFALGLSTDVKFVSIDSCALEDEHIKTHLILCWYLLRSVMVTLV